MSVRTKLAALLIILTIGVLLAAGLFIGHEVEKFFTARILTELEGEARRIEFLLRNLLLTSPGDEFPYETLQELARTVGVRLTLIAGDGTVQFESTRPREELVDAIRYGKGFDEPASRTIGEEMFYVAIPVTKPFTLEEGGQEVQVIRTGIPLTEVRSAVASLRWKILGVGILILMVSAFATIILARLVTRPLSEMARVARAVREGDLEQRIAVGSRDELGHLAEALNDMIDTLNRDITQLRKLERVRTEFLGNVSHELRTPIFAIQGMLETLLQGALDDSEVRRDFVSRALDNTRRLNTLLGDLIEISRIESGDMKMSFRYFEIHPFLKSVVEEMSPLAEQKNIRIHVETSSEPIEVFGDRERLKQAMMNLVDNAIKYSSAGTVIELSCREEQKGVKISVRDHGVGIAKEHIPRIFERFYRVDRERSREAGGTGLGLAIVKHIVEAHGSAVEVESTPGSGTTFTFSLRKS